MIKVIVPDQQWQGILPFARRKRHCSSKPTGYVLGRIVYWSGAPAQQRVERVPCHDASGAKTGLDFGF